MPFLRTLWTQTHSLKIYKYPRIIRLSAVFGFWDRIGLDRIGVLHSTDRMGSDWGLHVNPSDRILDISGFLKIQKRKFL